MLLIGRDTPVGDLTWSAVERMVGSALKISSEQQAERVSMAGQDMALSSRQSRSAWQVRIWHLAASKVGQHGRSGYST